MKTLRTLASALCIVLGALLIATWAASTSALNAIENSTVIEDATARAITTDVAQEALVEHGTTAVLAALDGAGVNTGVIGFKALVSALVDGVVSSEAFVNVVHAQSKSVREQMVVALNAGGEGPISVTIDFSDQVNDKLGEIPVIGGALPTIALPGVEVQVMDAQTADTARTTWTWMNVAAHWFGWLGLAFLVVGIAVSYRKRWFLAKVSLAVGVMSGLIWLVVTYLDPQSIANLLPGGGVADAIIVEVVGEATGSIATVMGWLALGAMMVSLVLFVVAARARKGGRA